MGHLEEYRAKRKASKTPEPMGGPAQSPRGLGPHLFVVQKHRATSMITMAETETVEQATAA